MEDTDLDPEERDSPTGPAAGAAARTGTVQEDGVVYDYILFPDGSAYTGTTKGGLPDGLGTCTWQNGNKYDGEWKNGEMHGFGTYIWTTGQRYDGEWKDGKQDGIGVKRYADGSTFDGFWKDGKKHGVGVFRPAKPERRGLLRSASGKLATMMAEQKAAGAGNSGDEKGPGSANAGPAAASTGATPALAPRSASASAAPEAGTGVAASQGALPQAAGVPPHHLQQKSAGATVAAIRGAIAAGATGASAAAGAGALPGAGSSAGPVPGDSAGAVPGDTGQAVLVPLAVPGGTLATSQPQYPSPPSSVRTRGSMELPAGRAPSTTGVLSEFGTLPTSEQQPLPLSFQGTSDAASTPQMATAAAGPHSALTPETLAAFEAQGELPAEPGAPPYMAPSMAKESVAFMHMAAHKPGQPRKALVADSELAGPSQPPDKGVVFIRRFEDGKLIHEDRLTQEEMATIFKDTWKKAKQEKKDEPRAKALGRTVRRALGIGSKLQQKQGQLIYKGMPGYDLMIRLQLGIRYSTARMNQQQYTAHGVQHATASAAVGASLFQAGALTPPAAPPEGGGQGSQGQLQGLFKVEPLDFVDKSKVFFPSSGSSTTPAHASSDFKWKDYCPKVFRNLRLMWGVHDAEYMLSLAGSQALRQLNSPGKSGCMFFLSDDERFIVKTMRKSEIRTLIAMLPQYYQHMKECRESLVTRFYGVYGVKEVHGRTVRFVVMSNIFCTDLQIHKKFDLKGSTYERTAGAADPSDPKSVFKDLDLDLTIQLPQELHNKLQAQLQRDAKFLEVLGVMDYSLLLGIHFCEREQRRPEGMETVGSGHHQHRQSKWGRGGEEDGEELLNGNRTHGTVTPPILLPGTSPFASPAVQPTPFTVNGHTPAVTPPSVACAQPPHSPNIDGISSHASPHAKAAAAAATAATAAAAAGVAAMTGAAMLLDKGQGEELDGPAEKERGPRNFDIFSNREEVVRQLAAVEARMREMGFSEQRIQDILGLAKLKILGDKLKKKKGRRGGRGKHVQSKSAGVIKALAQARQEVERGEDQAAFINPLAIGTAPTFRMPGAGLLGEGGSPFVLGGDVLDDMKESGSDGESGDGDGPVGGSSVKAPESPRDLSYPAALTSAPTFGASGIPLPPNHTGSTAAHDAAILHSLISRCQLGYNMPAVAVHCTAPAAAAKAGHSGTHDGSDPKALGQQHSQQHHHLGLNCLGGAGTQTLHEKPSEEEGAMQVQMASRSHLPQQQQHQEPVILCFGIIDILQDYNMRKLLERRWKALMHDSYAISVAPPDLYASRFNQFMSQKVFHDPLLEVHPHMQVWLSSLAAAAITASGGGGFAGIAGAPHGASPSITHTLASATRGGTGGLATAMGSLIWREGTIQGGGQSSTMGSYALSSGAGSMLQGGGGSRGGGLGSATHGSVLGTSIPEGTGDDDEERAQ